MCPLRHPFVVRPLLSNPALSTTYAHRGPSVDTFQAKAVEWWTKAAVDQGYPPSYTTLGRTFTEGAGGVEADLTKAFGFFMEGAKRGDPNGCTELARCYAEGEGVEKDLAAAATWLAKAEELAGAQ